MNILLLEDEPNDAELIKNAIARSGMDFNISYVTDRDEFTQAIQSTSFDVILSDNSLPTFSAVQAIRYVNEMGLAMPFILVTGTTSDEFAVEIMKEGAADYILKDRLHRLPSAILMAVNNHKIREERGRHLNEIVKSEALMKEAERLAKFGSWEVDRLKKTYYWSDQYYRILDYEIGEVSPNAASFYAKVHPEDHSFVKQTLDIVMEKLDNHGFDCRVIMNDGKIKHLYNRVNITRNEQRQVVRINGFAMDITDTRLAEEMLKKTELSYKRLVDNIIDGIIIDDFEGKIVYANDQFLKIFGYGREEIEGLILEDYVAPEYHETLRLRHNKRINGEKVPDVFEFIGVRCDGERIWVEVRVSRVTENGKVVGTQSAVRDITKSKNAEHLRQQTEANLRAIFDNTDTGFVLLDNKFKMKSFNPFANRISHELLDRTFANGRNISNYFKGEKYEMVEDALHNAMNKERVRYESEFLTLDNVMKWYSFNYDPVIDHENEPIGVLMTIKDITNRKLLELQGQRIKDDLIRRNNDLEQFAHIISHNLRAPVASIIGLSELILECNLEKDDHVEIVRNLAKSAENLDNIIKDINKILSVNKDVLESKETINLHTLTETIVQILEYNYEDAQFMVVTNFDAIDEIYTLKSYLHSIFLNLISNAIKYKKHDAPPVVEIKATKSDDKVIITFSDNGIGIDLVKYEKRIFGLFNRFHTHVEGKGMGLFMVKTQAELLGGAVSICSKVGEGTKITVELPIQ